MGICLAHCDVPERNLGEMQQRLAGGKVLVSDSPKVTVTLEELLGTPSMKFRPNAFSLSDLQLRIVLDVSSKKEDLANLEAEREEESMLKSFFGKLGMKPSKESHKLKLVAVSNLMKHNFDEKVSVSITNFKEGVESFKHVLSGGRASALVEDGISKLVSQVIHDMILDDNEDVLDDNFGLDDEDEDHPPKSKPNVKNSMHAGSAPPQLEQLRSMREDYAVNRSTNPLSSQQAQAVNDAADDEHSPIERGNDADMGIYGDFLADRGSQNRPV